MTDNEGRLYDGSHGGQGGDVRGGCVFVECMEGAYILEGGIDGIYSGDGGFIGEGEAV